MQAGVETAPAQAKVRQGYEAAQPRNAKSTQEQQQRQAHQTGKLNIYNCTAYVNTHGKHKTPNQNEHRSKSKEVTLERKATEPNDPKG